MALGSQFEFETERVRRFLLAIKRLGALCCGPRVRMRVKGNLVVWVDEPVQILVALKPAPAGVRLGEVHCRRRRHRAVP